MRLIFIAIILLLGLGISLWYAPSQILKARSSLEWPAVTGTVLETHIDETSSKNSGQKYIPVFTYRYVVADVTYENADYNIAGGPKLESRAEAEALQKQHPVGSSIEVRYDPDDPADALLEPGGEWFGWVLLAMGMLMVLLGTVKLRKQLRAV